MKNAESSERLYNVRVSELCVRVSELCESASCASDAVNMRATQLLKTNRFKRGTVYQRHLK